VKQLRSGGAARTAAAASAKAKAQQQQQQQEQQSQNNRGGGSAATRGKRAAKAGSPGASGVVPAQAGNARWPAATATGKSDKDPSLSDWSNVSSWPANSQRPTTRARGPVVAGAGKPGARGAQGRDTSTSKKQEPIGSPGRSAWPKKGSSGERKTVRAGVQQKATGGAARGRPKTASSAATVGQVSQASLLKSTQAKMAKLTIGAGPTVSANEPDVSLPFADSESGLQSGLQFGLSTGGQGAGVGRQAKTAASQFLGQANASNGIFGASSQAQLQAIRQSTAQQQPGKQAQQGQDATAVSAEAPAAQARATSGKPQSSSGPKRGPSAARAGKGGARVPVKGGMGQGGPGGNPVGRPAGGAPMYPNMAQGYSMPGLGMAGADSRSAGSYQMFDQTSGQMTAAPYGYQQDYMQAQQGPQGRFPRSTNGQRAGRKGKVGKGGLDSAAKDPKKIGAGDGGAKRGKPGYGSQRHKSGLKRGYAKNGFKQQRQNMQQHGGYSHQQYMPQYPSMPHYAYPAAQFMPPHPASYYPPHPQASPQYNTYSRYYPNYTYPYGAQQPQQGYDESQQQQQQQPYGNADGKAYSQQQQQAASQQQAAQSSQTQQGVDIYQQRKAPTGSKSGFSTAQSATQNAAKPVSTGMESASRQGADASVAQYGGTGGWSAATAQAPVSNGVAAPALEGDYQSMSGQQQYYEIQQQQQQPYVTDPSQQQQQQGYGWRQ